MSPERRALPDHGTWQRYVRKGDGCRCHPCRTAWRDYQRQRARDIAYGRRTIDSLVDPAPALAHLAAIRETGPGLRAVAAASGIPFGTLERIHQRKRNRIRQSTLDRILAVRVTPAMLDGRVDVEGVGVRRRLQALIANGWSMQDIAERLDCHRANIRQIVHSDTRVNAATWQRVTALYDRMWSMQPPAFTSEQRGIVRRTKRLAERNGWPPPLAWDDDTIDDPAAQPYAETRPTGARAATETAEEVADYLGHVNPFATASHLAERLGYRDVTGVQQALKRADRPDLLAQLARNAHIASNVTGRTA